MRMLGKLGWHGQCSCCNGPRSKHQIKRKEKKEWQNENRSDWNPLGDEQGSKPNNKENPP